MQPGRAPNYNPKGFTSPPTRGRPPKTSHSPRGGRGVERSEFSNMSRTRPCLYCGKTFFDRDELYRHEQVEAREFEREAMHFEQDSKNKVNQTMFESSHPKLHKVIDRTDEEFGDEYRFPENLKIETQHLDDISYATHTNGYANSVTHSMNQTNLCNNLVAANGTAIQGNLKLQYNTIPVSILILTQCVPATRAAARPTPRRPTAIPPHSSGSSRPRLPSQFLSSHRSAINDLTQSSLILMMTKPIPHFNPKMNPILDPVFLSSTL